MKRIGLFLIGILLAVTLNGQSELNALRQQKPIYRDYGAWTIQEGTNTVGVRAYITKERIYEPVQKQQYTKEFTSEAPKFRYELYLESKSVYNGRPTSTWLYNAKVFVNGREVTYEQFPNGFTASIGIEPTLIYWYEVPMPDLDMAITWTSAIYENRTY